MSKVIYLAGGMTGLNKEIRSGWRTKLEELFAMNPNVKVFDPNRHWNVDDPTVNEKEAMEHVLHNLRRVDLVVMNFNNKLSVGTNAELGIAYDRKIPVLGLYDGDVFDLHPWQYYMCQRIFPTIDDVYDYIVCHYIMDD